jgi:hypothetical protein
MGIAGSARFARLLGASTSVLRCDRLIHASSLDGFAADLFGEIPISIEDAISIGNAVGEQNPG